MKNYKSVTVCLVVCALSLLMGTVRSQSWSRLPATGSIPALSNSSGVYDSTNHRIILFGGLSQDGPTNNIQCLDLSTFKWTVLASKSTIRPAPRFSQNAMYDAINKRMFIWSGQGASLYNDVWAFNFADSTWESLSQNGNAIGKPLQRYGTAAIFDPSNNHLVTFAGFTTEGRFSDSWSFDTYNLVWREIAGTDGPLKRCLHAGAYSSFEKRMYIFGGQGTGNLNDLWALDIDGYKWNQIRSNIYPPARHFTTLISTSDRLLLFGGNASSQGDHSGGLDDLWQFRFSSQQWEQVVQDQNKPGARSGQTALYDSKTRSMIIIGGHKTDGSIYDDVWEYGTLFTETTGVETKTSHSSHINIFPNPCQEVLSIGLAMVPAADKITIYNAQGNIVFSRIADDKGLSTAVIATESLCAGVYLVFIQAGKTSYSRQFIKN